MNISNVIHDISAKALSFFGLCTIKSMQDERDKLNELISVHRRQQRLFGKIDKVSISKLKSWSKRVRAVGKCDICESSKKLTAHHIWDKKSHPTLMYQDDNGVCLCEKCHNEFHKRYPTGNQVTPSMYKKFKIKKQNEIIISKGSNG